MLVFAGGSPGTATRAEAELALDEVTLEGVPLLLGDVALVRARTHGPSVGDELAVRVDDVLGVDRGVDRGRLHRLVPKDGSDHVYGNAAALGVRREDPTQVVGP